MSARKRYATLLRSQGVQACADALIEETRHQPGGCIEWAYYELAYEDLIPNYLAGCWRKLNFWGFLMGAAFFTILGDAVDDVAMIFCALILICLAFLLAIHLWATRPCLTELEVMATKALKIAHKTDGIAYALKVDVPSQGGQLSIQPGGGGELSRCSTGELEVMR